MPLDRNDPSLASQLPAAVGQIKKRSSSTTSEGLYEGKVAYTADPLNLGRVKVRIPLKNDLTGVQLPGYPESSAKAPVEALPWAWPCAMPGTFVVPEVGSTVIVAFRQGNNEYPVYLGVIHAILNKQEVWGGDPNVLQKDLPTKASVTKDTEFASSRVLPLPDSSGDVGSNSLAYYKMEGNNAPEESFAKRKETAEPLVRVYASTTRGHSIFAVDEAESEELTIVDRLGQGLHFLSPVNEEKNKGNWNRRGAGTLRNKGTESGDEKLIYQKWGDTKEKLTSFIPFNERDNVYAEAGIFLQGLSDQSFNMTPAYGNYGGVAEIDAVGGKMSLLGEGEVIVGPPIPILVGAGDGTDQPPLELLAHGATEGSAITQADSNASNNPKEALPAGGVSVGKIVPGSVAIWTNSEPVDVDQGVENEALNNPVFGADGRNKPALKKQLDYPDIVPGTLVLNATESIEVQDEVLGTGDGTNRPRLNNFSEINISKGSVFLKAGDQGLFDTVGENGEGTFSLPGGGEAEVAETVTAGGKICYEDGTIIEMPTWAKVIPSGTQITATYKAFSDEISLIDDGSNAFVSNDANRTPVGGYIVYETGEIKNPPDWNIIPGPSSKITANYQRRIKIPLRVQDRSKGYLTGDGFGLLNYSTGTVGALKWEGPPHPTTGIPLVPGKDEPIYAYYRYTNEQEWVAKIAAHESKWEEGVGRTANIMAFSQHNKAVRIEEASPPGGNDPSGHLEISEGTVVLEAAGGAKVVLEGKKIYLNP